MQPNVNILHKESFSRLETLAVWVTQHVGSMWCFFVLTGWTVLWLGWNTLSPQEVRFDPFPAFVLWLFISNVMQLLWLPLIMVGQNLLGRHAEMRSECAFNLEVKSDRDLEVVLGRLSEQDKILKDILERMKS